MVSTALEGGHIKIPSTDASDICFLQRVQGRLIQLEEVELSGFCLEWK